MTALWAIIGCGALSIVYGIWATQSVMSADAGSQKMQEIAAAIAEGAQAYLKRQYMTIAIVGAVVFVGLWILLGALVAIGFLIGAVLSGAAGFIGMNVSVRANVRTAQAATKSLAEGLDISFKAGAVTGMLVAGLALLGVALYYWFLIGPRGLAPESRTVIDSLVALSLRRLADLDLRSSWRRHLHQGRGRRRRPRRQGRSRHSGGRSAQPGDHRRQRGRQRRRLRRHGGRPVRDLCGDRRSPPWCSPRSSSRASRCSRPRCSTRSAICGACIVTSIIGTFFVKLGANGSIMGALYKGLIAGGVLSIGGLWIATQYILPNGFGTLGTVAGMTITGRNLFICGVLGLVVTGLIVWITEYYTGTGKRPVVSIAQASVTGHGTNVIQGLAVSLEATALPALVIVAGIIVTYQLAGLFGTAIAVTTMLGLAGIIVALDAFGPVTDNAGGIAEMAACRRKCVTTPTRSTRSATPPRR